MSSVSRLLDELENAQGEVAIAAAMTDLRDLIEYGDWTQAEYQRASRLLSANYFKTKPPEMFLSAWQGTLQDLYMYRHAALRVEDVQPILDALQHSDDQRVLCPAIKMLSLTRDQKFKPFVEPFLTHSNPVVSGFAAERIAKFEPWL
jgi:hypothetical protein